MASDQSDLERWDREIVWHAFTQMAEYEPFIIERAQGCTLFAPDGREYLDGVSSLWCNVHGHRHPRLDAALREQLDRVAHVTALGMSNPTSIRLAKHLTEITPAGLTHVFFCSDGSSSVEVALKMSLQFWRQQSQPRPLKTKYIAFDDAYHGDTLGSVSVGGVARFHEMFRPLLFEVLRLPAPGTYRRPTGVSAEHACEYYLQRLEEVLASQHQQIAALVIEPLVQCAAGMVMHPTGFLRGVRELTSKYEVLLIADEVAVGFGRTGSMFACEREGVSPDFLCLGKGITGGYLALSATVTTDQIWNAFLGAYDESKTFCHGHTYGGNPLAAAVALASLAVFEEEQTLAAMPAKTKRLQEHLRRISEHPYVGDVRQCGLIAGIELVRDRESREPFPWSEQWGQRVCDHALSEGVWLRPLGNVVVIMPPLAITLAQLDRICYAVEKGIEKCRELSVKGRDPNKNPAGPKARETRLKIDQEESTPASPALDSGLWTPDSHNTTHSDNGTHPCNTTRHLLLQVRNQNDPMRPQEVHCFARALGCDVSQIRAFDLLAGSPTAAQLDQADVVFLGGSGDYSVAEGGPWLPAALEVMRELHRIGKPTFASCWGFQAMARALGGDVITDIARAEVGSIEVELTDAGRVDPLFAELEDRFLAQMGHHDIVVRLPDDAILLASSQRVENQAFRFDSKPIYCTQFHPELNREALLQRVWAYPWYIDRIRGISLEEFAVDCQESPATDELLRRFVTLVLS